jgi:hypothetical protein
MAEEYGRLTTRPVLPTVAVDVMVMGFAMSGRVQAIDSDPNRR